MKAGGRSSLAQKNKSDFSQFPKGVENENAKKKAPTKLRFLPFSFFVYLIFLSKIYPQLNLACGTLRPQRNRI